MSLSKLLNKVNNDKSNIRKPNIDVVIPPFEGENFRNPKF